MYDLRRFPNAAIELHDSWVEAVRREGARVVVELAPSVLFRSARVPGRDDSLAMIQDAELVFEAGRIEGTVGDLPASILDGSLQVSGERFDNMIALPCEAVGITAELEVLLAPDARKVTVRASGVQITMKGEPSDLSPWPGT